MSAIRFAKEKNCYFLFEALFRIGETLFGLAEMCKTVRDRGEQTSSEFPYTACKAQEVTLFFFFFFVS